MIGLEQMLPVVLFGGALVVAGGAFALSQYLERKRRLAMAAMAQRLNMSFTERDYSLASAAFSDLPIFNLGHSHTYLNILRGRLDGNAEALLFDYEYTTGSGKNRQTHRQTIAALAYGKGGLPRFELRPENLFHRIGEVFGYQDIDFAGHEGFSKSYLLRGPDEAPIRALFGLNLLQYFEAHPGWSVQGGGGWLAAWRQGQRVEPENLPAFLDETKLLLWAFPR